MNRLEFDSESQYLSKADRVYHNQYYTNEPREGNSFAQTSPTYFAMASPIQNPYDQRSNEREYYSSREVNYPFEQHSTKNKESFTSLYKNFNIIHTDHAQNHMLNSVMTIQSVEYDNSPMPKPEEEPRIKTVFSNTNISQISQILTESSREIDKINKMLEEHRRKKAQRHEHDHENSPVNDENKQYQERYHDASSNQRLVAAKENLKPKETILVEDYGNQKSKPHQYPNGRPNLQINPINNTAVLKEIVHENISTKNSSTKRAMEAANDSFSKKSAGQQQQSLYRQASSGKLTGNKAKTNPPGSENKMISPVGSASKITNNTKSFLSHGVGGDLKSPKTIVSSEKAKSKSLNKEKNSSRSTHRSDDKEGQKGIKTTKYTSLLARNSRKEKENEDVFQKLSIRKQQDFEYSRNQEIAVKQLKSMKGAVSQEPRTPNSGKSETTPQFKTKESLQSRRTTENENYEKKQSGPNSQRKGLYNEAKENNMVITTAEHSNFYKENMSREPYSIPSSVKSQKTISIPQELLKLKKATSAEFNLAETRHIPDMGVQPAGYEVHTSNSTAATRTPLTPHEKTMNIEKAKSPSRSPNKQANNTIKIYNRILGNPVYHSAAENHNQKGVQVDEKKLEIIQSNLARLQKEYLLISGQRRSGRHCDYGLESTLNINTNPQIVNMNNINERLSKTSKHSNELERLSNYTAQSTSKGTTSASQESLMKSYLLRQNLLNQAAATGSFVSTGRSPQKDGQADFESPKREFPVKNVFLQHPNTYLSPHGKATPEDEIYNRNSEWLSNKKNKIESMSSVKDKEEMKECTFRPNIFSKTSRHGGSIHQNFNGHLVETKSGIVRTGHKLRGNGITIESPRHDHRVLQTEPSSRNKKDQATYRQMHESRKSQNIYLDESLSNSTNKGSYVSSKKI